MSEQIPIHQTAAVFTAKSGPKWWTNTSTPQSLQSHSINLIYIKCIVPVLDSDRLSLVPSCCKILCKHTAVTALQQYNCTSQTSCFKMSDFDVFDLLGGLSLDKWWKEMDRMGEEEKK